MTWSSEKIAKITESIATSTLSLKTISTKGLKVWPRDDEYMVESDHWCCRFMSDSKSISHSDIINLLSKFIEANIDFIKIENLYEFDGKRGYSLAQGE